MAAKTQNQKAYALLSYYKKIYSEKYRRQPKTNQYADKWGFVDLLSDVNEDEARELLDFYLRTNSPTSHSLQWFFFNYHELIASMQESRENEIKRAELREATRQRVEAYRKRGNHRSETD